MTSANPVPIQDIEQAQHENNANAKRSVLFGKTTGGTYTPFQVDSSGKLIINKTYSKIIYIEDPFSTDDYPLAFIPKAATIKSLNAITDTSTVDFNIEKRNKLTPDVSGTDINSSDFQATSSGLSTTSFSSGAVSADTWLTYVATTTGLTPTKLWISITYEYS